MMNIRERLVSMKRELMLMMDDAIANYDKALARQSTDEWKEFADEYDYPISFMEECFASTARSADKIIDNLNCELYAFEDAAETPYDEFL